MHQRNQDTVQKIGSDPAPSSFFSSSRVLLTERSDDQQTGLFLNDCASFQKKGIFKGLSSSLTSSVFCCITNFCQWCRINRKTSEKSCCTRGKGGDVTITTDLCDLYEQMDGLRLACRRERAVLDRRVEWLKQVTDLVSRMEGVCDEFQNLIEAQPRRAEPYEVQEHIEQTIHSLTHAMNRIKEGEA